MYIYFLKGYKIEFFDVFLSQNNHKLKENLRDSYKHKGQRKQLTTLLQEKGISDPLVLQAIEEVPRHLFIDSAFADFAYKDQAFPILAGQTISQPYTVAFQSQLLQINPGEKVLEIGTGSAYQTAILLKMGAQVYTVERQKELYGFAKKILKKLNLTPKFQSFGDGYKGLPTYGPFDKIIVTAGAPMIPKPLLEQLSIGGILVIPIGEKEQTMTTILRLSEKEFEKLEFGSCQFVPLLEDRN